MKAYIVKEIIKGSQSDHFIGRLLLFIKDAEKIPSASNLRPINISSVIIKGLEQFILEDI